MFRWFTDLWARLFGAKHPHDELARQLLNIDWSPYQPVREPGSEPRAMKVLRPEEQAFAVSALLRKTKDRHARRRFVAQHELALRDALRRHTSGEARSQP